MSQSNSAHLTLTCVSYNYNYHKLLRSPIDELKLENSTDL